MDKPSLNIVRAADITAHAQQFSHPWNPQSDMFGTQLELLMAASLIHIIPTVILFFVAQRYFIKGIAMTGLK